MNQAILIGVLGRDPELKMSKNNRPYCKFSLATKVPRENAESTTYWINCVAFGKNAEKVARASKGQTLFVTGVIQVQTYEKNGEKRYDTSINVEHVNGSISISAAPQQEVQRDLPILTKTAQTQVTSFDDDSIPF